LKKAGKRRKSLLDRINIDEKICHGQPVIKKTRVLVSVILDNLAEGASPEEIVDLYDGIVIDDVRAAVAYHQKHE